MADGPQMVLVVDDDAAVRGLAGRILRREGYAVLEAADADSALEAARSADGGVALLLTDVILPGANGADLAGRLRAQVPGLRVVFMSGFGEEELQGHGIEEVGAAYITKPFTADVLTLMVRGALEP